MNLEKPDAIMIMSDPRWYIWLFNMEDEIRKTIPISYLNIWDSIPYPMFNSEYYESCDLLMGISKQTVHINEMVLGDKLKNRILKYIPHGIDHTKFYPIQEDDTDYNKFKNILFKGDNPEFVLFFNSRNIRRKQIPDSLLAFKHFLDQLPYEKALKCKFILKTEIVSDHGTDLEAVREYLFEEKYPNNVMLIQHGFNDQELNYLYNIADAQILLTSNEGWGMTITEAILAGTPIIANVQGGLQDQMRFEDENGDWYAPSQKVPSNHNGTYKKHGEWAFPVYPSNLSLQGSPLTPYIYDDRCKWEDASERIMELYNMTREERKSLGLKGREWAVGDEAGFTSKHQAERVIGAIDELFSTWIPRENYEVLNVNDYKGKFINHPLVY